jgi:hypothetical protein
MRDKEVDDDHGLPCLICRTINQTGSPVGRISHR